MECLIMKFNRLVAFDWSWSARKEAALKRKQANEVARLALFAEEVKSELESVEDIIAARQQQYLIRAQQERNDRAAAWRSARAKLFQLPKEHRLFLRRKWRHSKWITREPHYLADMIHGYIVHGKRPTKFVLESYGELLQPVDYCEVNFVKVKVKVKVKVNVTERKIAQALNYSLF